ncbi:MAG: hypothetical protein LBC02_10840 [Planctomycetaceae bacterium]|jgi:hypothetical protein|nr:hypothetical protein [Planctomycetaceae bacterium]
MGYKKITRRIVLGTVLGSLVTAPFIAWALRKKKELKITDHVGDWLQAEEGAPLTEVRIQFFKDWKKIHKSLSVEQSPIEVPKTVVLKHNFTKHRHLKFRSLETFFDGNFDSPETCQPSNLMGYTLMEGTIEVEGGEQGKLHICIDKHERNMIGIDFEASRKNGVKIVEKKLKNPDGTMFTNVTTQTGGFSFDPATNRYKPDIVEKIFTIPFPVGQFLFRNTLSFDIDNHKELSLMPNGTDSISMGYCFYHLIKFPLPEQLVEIGQEFEFPITPQDLMLLEIPSYKAQIQRMVKCNNFNTVNVVPVCAPTFAEYREHLHKQYDIYNETIKDQLDQLTDEQIKNAKLSFYNKIEEVEKKIKNGIPKMNYFIDLEMGCVVRREEYDTGKHDIYQASAVQRIFQLF